MKKTTRSSTFETNSSSTHVYSFSALVKGRYDLTVVPDESNEIKIKLDSNWFDMDSTVHPVYKTSLLLMLAKSLFDDEKVELVKKVVEDFTGAKVVVTGLTKVKKIKLSTEDKDNSEEFSELFSGLDMENSGVDDHIKTANKYLVDEESIKTFIFCSKNKLDEEITYS